jgi:TATA-box binding protein (TBP) (component of TFIID and TFIIIB)
MHHNMVDIDTDNNYDIDNAWSLFCKYGNINDEVVEHKVNSDKKPIASDIYISTKTKIAYLNQPIDLDEIFLKIKVIPYHIQETGVVKKQMKFNFTDQEAVDELIKKIENESNVDNHIISRIINPNGRIKFKDIRKISIGLCQKDILSYRSKKRSAFYNCFVLILRIKLNDKFKEIHVKVFNTGKLEIPGIKEESTLITTLDLLVKNLRLYSTNQTIDYDLSKSETVLINSNFNCGFYLDRDNLLQILKNKYNIDCIYDSCQYPGIQCKYYLIDEKTDKNYSISFMIFRTGSVLIVGRCEESTLRIVYSKIKKILEDEYYEILANYIETDKKIEKNKNPKKKQIYYN